MANIIDRILNIVVTGGSSKDLDGIDIGLTKVKQSTSNLTSVTSGLDTVTGGLSGTLIKAAESTGLLSLAQKGFAAATATGTGALKIFQIALASTGIGLIIAAVALLIDYFKDFDPLMDALEQGFAGLGAAINVVEQYIGNMVAGFHSVGDVIKALGNFLLHPIDSFKKLGGEMKSAASAAMDLKAISQDLADDFKKQETQNKRFSEQYDELILKSKNRTLSEKERISFLKEAIKLEEDNFKQNKSLGDRQWAEAIAIAKQKKKLTIDEVADLQKRGVAAAIDLQNKGRMGSAEIELIQKAEEKKIAIQNESNTLKLKAQNRADALADKADAKAQAIRDKRKADLDQIVKNEIDAQNAILAASTSSENAELLNVDIKFKDKLALAKQYGKDTTALEAQIQIEKDKISKRYDKIEEDANKKKKDILKKYADDLLDIEAVTEVDKANRQHTKDQEALDAFNLFGDDKLAAQKALDDKFAIQLQAAADKDIKINEAKNDKNKKDDEAAAKKKEALMKQRVDATFGATQALISGIDEMNNEQTDRDLKNAGTDEKKKDEIRRRSFESHKKLQLASAIVTGIQGVMMAFTTSDDVYVGIALAAAAAIAAAANISKIESTTFDSGGNGGGAIGGTTIQPQAQFNIVSQSQTNQLGQSIGNQTPIQAYVVGSNVTTQQALDRNRIQLATFL